MCRLCDDDDNRLRSQDRYTRRGVPKDSQKCQTTERRGSHSSDSGSVFDGKILGECATMKDELWVQSRLSHTIPDVSALVVLYSCLPPRERPTDDVNIYDQPVSRTRLLSGDRSVSSPGTVPVDGPPRLFVRAHPTVTRVLDRLDPVGTSSPKRHRSPRSRKLRPPSRRLSPEQRPCTCANECVCVLWRPTCLHACRPLSQMSGNTINTVFPCTMDKTF